MKSIRKHSMAAAVLTVLLLVTLPVTAVFAATSSRAAGTGADDASVGSIAWTNPGYITASDTNYAKAVLPALTTSHFLKATNFGFNIPVDAPIVGVQVSVLRKASSSTSLQDYSIKLLKAGVPTGSNRAKSPEWSNLWETVLYGSFSDLWGTTWTPADFNDPNFGVVFSVRNNNTDALFTRTASVNYIRISVTYGTPSTTGVTCAGPATYGSGTLCTATVTRTGLVGTPTGTVNWTSNGSGTFSGGGACTLSGADGTATCSVTYTPDAVGTGSHLITATYMGDATFAGSIGNKSLTVNKRPLTVTATGVDKIYDATTAATVTLTGNQLPGDDVLLSYVSAAFLSKDVGVDKLVQVTGISISGGLNAADYTLTNTTADTTATISKANLTVTADDKTMVSGDPDPEFTFTYGTFLGADTSADINIPPTCTVSGAHTVPDVYPITCSGGIDNNYSFLYVDGTLTVFPAGNRPPTDISLSPSAVQENRPAGTTVGSFTSTDPDPGDTFTYTFCGGLNDSAFQIPAGTNILKTKVMFNYEAKKSYSICVQTDDGNGGTYQETMTVTVLDLPETFISLGAQDGWVLESLETSNQGGTVGATGPYLVVGDNAANKQYRSILSFKTSGIPDGAVITKVVLKLRGAGVAGTNPFTTHGKLLVDIRKGAFSSNSALQTLDFQAAANKPGVTYFTNTPVNGWYARALPSTGFIYINKTGLTQFRLRFALDDNNDSGADYIKFASGNYTTAAYRPVLIVQYTVP